MWRGAVWRGGILATHRQLARAEREGKGSIHRLAVSVSEEQQQRRARMDDLTVTVFVDEGRSSTIHASRR